jgi:hypothetical protein
LSPFPTVTTVEVSKRSLSILSHRMSSPVQGRSACFHLNHRQHKRKVRASLSRSIIPSPQALKRTNSWPVYQAMSSTNFIWFLSFPKEVSSHLVDLFQ